MSKRKVLRPALDESIVLDMTPVVTKRQRQILEMIRQCISTNGMPPTRAEMAKKFGFSSPNAIQCQLESLQRKGFIELLPNISRGIRLKGFFV